MSKRYRLCETCEANHTRADYDTGKYAPCPDCGHGDCAPGVVDAGVVWQSEVPTGGVGWAWHPSAEVGFARFVTDGIYCDGEWCPSKYLSDGLWRFAPLTIPDPPKE